MSPAGVPPFTPPPITPPSAPRYFECSEDGADKFWEISVAGCEVTVRFGRRGTRGQSQTKTFTTVESAGREKEKLVRSKTGKGYIECTKT